MKTRLLAAVIAAVLTVGAAQANEPEKAPVAQQQATQQEIDRLVERIQVLSKQLGENVRVIVRRADRLAPHAMDETMPGDWGGFRSGPGLGIVMTANPAAAGVRIAAITPDSPAMKAGLRSGDVLLSVDGRTITGSGTQAVDSTRHLLGDLKQGQVVRLRCARQGKTYDANVKADTIRRMMVLNRDEDHPMAPPPGMRDDEHHRRMMMLPPNVQRDIERMGPMAACPPGDDDCGMPALYQAFRWQDLNLASMDASLGRYFGTDTGVLVLGSGPEMKSLQSGDVIKRVAGNPVESPRDVMRVLREKNSGSQLQFEVWREHKPATVTVTVPKSRPLPFMAPPPPPAPPAPPAPFAAPAPPAPPLPPGSPHGPHAAPPAPPAPPAAPGMPRPPRGAPPPPPPPPPSARMALPAPPAAPLPPAPPPPPPNGDEVEDGATTL
jgi:hypothetical protein